MDKAYYKEYYHFERENWWFVVRYKIINYFLNKYLTNKSKIKILNIGVATGYSTELLMKYGEVVSLEYDKDCCKFISEKLNIEVIHGSITSLPFEDESFDLVCAFDVIEHVEDDELGVQEIRRVCKKNGLVFITVPAFMSLWSRHDEINFHFRRYKKNQILQLFNKLQIIHKTYFNSFLFLPIYFFRTIINLFPNFKKNATGSDFSIFPKESFINSIFKAIFNIEFYLLKFMIFPFGVSFLFIGKKNN
ncbi:MAG: hypothetical protein A3K10_04115 [Bacteroidetes bacterium RIFCSPLOWO2_12_FULL_31_6]|nr:MAG: hypothetical protein A3K10_04115 [Bacteroidetes bacterium RIFCSPLOWO2_12_FULL_31_6]